MLLLPHHDNRREHDSTCVFCVCAYVCVGGEMHTLSCIQTCMWLIGVFCPGSAVIKKQNWDSTKPISNQSWCTWTWRACGLTAWEWCVRNVLHFCVHLKSKNLKKKWDHNVKNIYSCFCITGESCAQILCIYNVVHYRGTLFFGTILYIAIAVKSNRPYIILCRSCSRSVLFVLFCFF